MEEQPKIIVNVFAKNSYGKIIALKRKKQNEWTVPGGHLEKLETIFECAIRECKEESGVNIKCNKILGFSHNILTDIKMSYILFWVEAELISGELTNVEPDIFCEVKWTTLENFPTPIFGPLKRFFNKEYIETK